MNRIGIRIAAALLASPSLLGAAPTLAGSAASEQGEAVARDGQDGGLRRHPSAPETPRQASPRQGEPASGEAATIADRARDRQDEASSRDEGNVRGETPLDRTRPQPADPVGGAEKSDGSSTDRVMTDEAAPPARAQHPGWLAPITDNWLPLLLSLILGTIGGLLGSLLAHGRIAKPPRHRPGTPEPPSLEKVAQRLDQVEAKIGLLPIAERLNRLDNELGAQKRQLQALASDRRPERMAADDPSYTRTGEGARHADVVAAAEAALVSNYASLLRATPTPRQFDTFLNGYGVARAVRVAADGRILATDYSGNDASELLVGVQVDDATLLVVPTFEYLSNFGFAFRAAVQNPAEVRHVFDLNADASGQLQLIRPARVQLEDGGQVRLAARGQMSGFAG